MQKNGSVAWMPVVGSTQAEQQEEERIKRNEEGVRELWGNIKNPNIHLIGLPDREKREK